VEVRVAWEDYRLVRAARYLGVPPWELMDRPAVWVEMALEFEQAEAWAEAERLRQANGG